MARLFSSVRDSRSTGCERIHRVGHSRFVLQICVFAIGRAEASVGIPALVEGVGCASLGTPSTRPAPGPSATTLLSAVGVRVSPPFGMETHSPRALSLAPDVSHKWPKLRGPGTGDLLESIVAVPKNDSRVQSRCRVRRCCSDT